MLIACCATVGWLRCGIVVFMWFLFVCGLGICGWVVFSFVLFGLVLFVCLF